MRWRLAALAAIAPGLIPWMLRRGIYLANFPTFARKVRVLFEWIWTCLFPVDIAHLNLSRTSLHRPANRQRIKASAKPQ